METFPIVKGRDEKKYNGDYRTKRVILEIYDAMQESIRTGRPYQTRLDPPPADPRCCHPPRVTIVDISDTAANILPFRRVRPSREDRYKTCVPFLSVKAAAGSFGEDQDVEFDDWVEIKASLPFRKGMFVAQVVGHSMEPLIHDGSYCLFQFKAPHLKNDMIGLFQLHAADDPETGGRFTVKRLNIRTTRDANGELHRVSTLVPENPTFPPMPVMDEDVKFVAEFLEVLHPMVSGANQP
jgi:SOS-response transcriptional repressor LexA